MNNKELQAARKLLMLDVSEAAEHVGGVSPRSWQYWESGRNAVPEDVSDEMQSLLRMRSDMIADVFEQSGGKRGKHFVLRYYNSLGEFIDAHPDGTVRGWRLHQSVAAHYYAGGGVALE